MPKQAAKVGRNDSCPCGSGLKFKRCCEAKAKRESSSRFLMIVVGGMMVAALLVGVVSFMTESSSSGVRVYDPAHGHYHDASGREVP